MAALIVKLLTCDKYSYVFFLSTINCLIIGTVVTLFLFIQHSVPLYLFAAKSLFLFIYLVTAAYLFLFYLVCYRRIPISYLFIADRMEQHLEVTWTIGSD